MKYSLALTALAFFLSATPADATGFDAQSFGKLPAMTDGRVKPLDSAGAHALLSLRKTDSYKDPSGTKLSAGEWILEIMMDPTRAIERKVFRVDHPDLAFLLGTRAGERFFSFQELNDVVEKIWRLADAATGTEAPLRSHFQREVLELRNNMCLFSALANTVCPPDVSNIGQEIDRWRQIVGKEGTEFEAHRLGNELDRDAFDAFLQVASVWRFMDQPGAPRLIPAKDHHENWQTPGAAFAAFSRSGKLHPLAERYMRLAEAYRAGDPRKFNDLISEIRSDTTALAPRESLRAEMEWFFNRTRVFFRCAVLYVIVFLLICVSWLREDWRKWGTVAFGLLVCVFALHSAGIGIRMYIHGRPPVTNLYASAVFVGWSSVLLGIFLERFWREGMGAACASVTGFLALAISENLTNAGDSMEPLRAVLDSNFWLAVHVPTIAIGYAATFVAGFLGLLFVFRGFFTRSLSENTAASLERMTYGIVCFSLLFGFIGTVTGGIWADRSWGRFWGWDPKENGALLIVLWNASILHARRDGMIRRQGLMALAILGNCVTAWSWFGTNMLNVGLHSYGFMEKTFFWLISFWASQIFMAAVGILPLRMWESFRLNSSEKKND